MDAFFRIQAIYEIVLISSLAIDVWMRTCKPAAGLLKGEQWHGRLEGAQLMRLEDSS
jgi:hypothetical protein